MGVSSEEFRYRQIAGPTRHHNHQVWQSFSPTSYRVWAVQEHTGVQPKRQKLLGLKTKQGKLASDDILVSDLFLKAGQKIMMVG